jgi:tetratricopeptide (TPR) repeat protein
MKLLNPLVWGDWRQFVSSPILKMLKKTMSQSTTHSEQLAKQLEEAQALHQKGDVKAALDGYRAILKRDPKNFAALFFCAMAEAQLEKLTDARRSIRRAIKVRPESADAHNAEGNVLMSQGKLEHAVKCFETALKFNSDLFIARYNLGNALKAEARFEEAIENYQKAIALRPDFWEAHNNLGTTYERLERWEEAIDSFRSALGLKPSYEEAFFNMGNVLCKAERYEEAVENYSKALALDPDYTGAQYNLANALKEMQRFKEAIVAYEKALARDPKMSEAHNNIGLCNIALMRFEDAVESFKRALAINPKTAFAKFNLGSAHFFLCDYEQGWLGYEGRDPQNKDPKNGWLRGPKEDWWLGDADMVRRPFGAAIEGKNLLVQGEQGLGDEIMLASMIPDVLDAVKNVIITIEPRLVGLFQRSFPQCQVVSRLGKESPLPKNYDETYRVFLGSLGQIFRNRLEDFPRKSYLLADQSRRTALRARLDTLGPGKKTGIMWRGGIGGNTEMKRSLSLADMVPLLSSLVSKGGHWISLSHLSEAADEVEQLFKNTGIQVHHWPDVTEAKDYDETAALLSELDVVVSTTGTVAHCAGALGVEAHVMVPNLPGWRYAQCLGPVMPWYGSMVLHRQTKDGVWPFKEITKAIGLA